MIFILENTEIEGVQVDLKDIRDGNEVIDEARYQIFSPCDNAGLLPNRFVI